MCLLRVGGCIENPQEFSLPAARLNRFVLKQARDLILQVELLTVTFLLVGRSTCSKWDEAELLVGPEKLCLVNGNARWVILKVKLRIKIFKCKKFVKNYIKHAAILMDLIVVDEVAKVRRCRAWASHHLPELRRVTSMINWLDIPRQRVIAKDMSVNGFVVDSCRHTAELWEAAGLWGVNNSRFCHFFLQQSLPELYVVVGVRPHQPRSARQHVKRRWQVKNLPTDVLVVMTALVERAISVGDHSTYENRTGRDAADEVKEIEKSATCDALEGLHELDYHNAANTAAVDREDAKVFRF